MKGCVLEIQRLPSEYDEKMQIDWRGKGSMWGICKKCLLRRDREQQANLVMS